VRSWEEKNNPFALLAEGSQPYEIGNQFGRI
jgi:hypothetical protein